ncbi:hypothetical protein BJ684DRAFT_19727 [Piptocephalis cylindrospora]|uniref:Uncharacterized protein n=1 Tax=Piptocephalis cylindrospora TaxID=1907219 RepID=A0A4P9Y4H8_9FUNG|nr:hypothetical protein BJ684DRAFT_19727 [Piptocephalis cylindrospora]|eukprot:RKP13815.1 hypothetical protein BJ684DRAFT_19727 [Piptocephalis cylindrospora]
MNKLTLTTLLVALAYLAPGASASPTNYEASDEESGYSRLAERSYQSPMPPRSTLADVKVEIGRRCGKHLVNADANVLGLVGAKIGLLRRGNYATSPSNYEGEGETEYGNGHGKEYGGETDTGYGGGHGKGNALSNIPCEQLNEYAQEYETEEQYEAESGSEEEYGSGQESEEEYGNEEYEAPAPAPAYEAPAPAPVYESPAPAPAPSYEAPAPSYKETPTYKAPAPAPAPAYKAPAPAPAYKEAPAPAPEHKKTEKGPSESYHPEESYEQGPSYSAPKGGNSEDTYAEAQSEY